MMGGAPPPEPRDESRRKAMAAVRDIFERYRLVQAAAGKPAFDNSVMRDATLLDASAGPPPPPRRTTTTTTDARPPGPDAGVLASATFRLRLGQEYANYNGVMHGGAAGVVFDMTTTMALGPVARPGFWTFLGGVTRSLNITYLKGVPVGTTVIVHARVYQAGRTAAYIKGWMTSEDGRTTFAVCEHNKIHVPTPEEHMAHRVGWDGLWEEDGDGGVGGGREARTSKL